MVKDRAGDLIRNETSTSAKMRAKKLRGAQIVKGRAEDLARNKTTTGGKTGTKTRKCSGQPAITCTKFAARPNSEYRGPATSFPGILGAILG